jgi:hypothetical protein
MKYGAITLDTSIFDQQGLKLDRGLLKTLEQFKRKPIGLVLSEIVFRELHKHLSKKVSETRHHIERALNQSSEYLLIKNVELDVVKEKLIPSLSDEDISKVKIQEFVDRTGLEIIKAEDYVEIKNLVKRYFHASPPFAEAGKKKNEFPDAIALMSLEAVAQKRRYKILAISADNDWAEYGKHSEWIDVVGDLADGISKFQPQATAFNFCERLGKQLLDGGATKISGELESFLSEVIPEINASPDADSAFNWDAEYIDIVFSGYKLQFDEKESIRIAPVQFQEGEISIAMPINIQGSASGEFTLSVYDSIDKDDVHIGTSSKTVEFGFDTELLITISGDLEGDISEVEVDSIELLSSPRHIDFGNLEPNWWREHEE